MNRRHFLLSSSMAAAATIASPLLLAQEPPTEPFRRIGPNSEDKTKVLAFFQFSCPACRATHKLLDTWGTSLPNSLSFEFVPVVYPDMSVIASARAWLAAGRLGREAQRTFEIAAYQLIQEGGHDPVQTATWAVVARQAGLSHSAYSQAWQQIGRDDVENLGHVFFRNQVLATPSVVLGGRYLVTPDNVNGNEALFTQLLNGVASAVIEGRTL